MIRTAMTPLFLALALGGCVVGPRYEAPAFVTPSQWSAGDATPESPQTPQAFWDGFGDPMLTRLIHEAIAGNLDLRSAGERIRVADDAVRVAAASGLPQVSWGAAAEDRRQTQTLDIPPGSPRFGEYPFYSFGFNASWELDLFGEARRRRESAEAGAGVAIEARRGIAVSLSAAVASTYATFRATEARLQIARESLHTARQAQTLAHHAYDAGDRSHLDVSEADARVDGLEAAIPPLQAQADNLTHALAILLGGVPEAFGRADLEGSTGIPLAPPLPPTLPSEVIARRPDIRAAERVYAEANADVGVSIAGLYPHFSIPLSYGPTTSSLDAAFKGASLLWRVGLGATQPIYTGGRLAATVDAAKARKAGALIAYRQTVLKAFGEVEDALTLRASERSRQDAISAQVAAGRQGVREAQRRYGQGQASLLPVLDLQRELFAGEDAQVASALASCLATISLYKAIGGGWEGVRPGSQAPAPAERPGA